MAVQINQKRAQLLPDLKPFEGLQLEHPLALLTPEELTKLHKELDAMARNRREAEASTSSLPVS